jgi:hypothetical protein
MQNKMTENTFIKPKGRVFHMIPWNSDKNVGKSYNESMSMVKTNDWVCFLDGDAVHAHAQHIGQVGAKLQRGSAGEVGGITCYGKGGRDDERRHPTGRGGRR